MSAIEPQNYEGYSLAEKHAWVTGQPGLRAVEAAATSVRTMGERLGTITTEAGNSMRGLGVSWAGPASEAAQRSSQEIVDRAADTQSLASNGAARILDYGHSFDEMRRKVVYDDPAELSWISLAMEPNKYVWDLRPWADAEDHVSVLRRNQEHDAAANDALRWHEANARAADDGFVTDGQAPSAVPIGATAHGTESGAGGGAAGVGASSSAPPTVSAAHAPPSVAAPPAAPSPAPAPPPAAAPASLGPAAVPVPAGPGASPPAGSGGGAGSGTTAGGPDRAGPGRTGPGGTGPGGTTSAAGAPGPAGAAGSAGPNGANGLADAAQERIRRGEQFGRDLTAGSPAARAGAGGVGGRPGGWAGSGAGTGGRPVGGWGSSGPDGRSPLTGGTRPGSGYGAWRGGGVGEPGGLGGYGASRGGGPGLGVPGGPGEPSSRLPGESGSRTWSRTPVEGPLGRTVVGEPTVTGRGGAGPGYAPMMGGMGGMRSDGDAHRNRYLLPTSEPFDVDLPHSPPVLAPEEDG